jgi:hypothetical protein
MNADVRLRKFVESGSFTLSMEDDVLEMLVVLFKLVGLVHDTDQISWSLDATPPIAVAAVSKA